MISGRAPLAAAATAGTALAVTALAAVVLALVSPSGAGATARGPLSPATRATPAATAAATGFITVRHGDVITVKSARLGCLVQLVGVICYPTRSGKPRVGSFAVTLVAPGISSIARIGPGLDLKPVVTKLARGVKLHRRDRVPEAAARTVTLAVGQVTRLKVAKLGTPIDCAVVRSAGLPTLYCSLDDAKGPVPGSFAVIVNERQAALGKVEASRATTPTNVRAQPR